MHSPENCYLYVNNNVDFQIGEILEVVETSKIYQIGHTKTNKGVKIRHGTDEKTFRFEFVSNSDITQDEFIKWKEACDRKGVALPTMEDITKKVKELKDANEYQFKEEDIEHVCISDMTFSSFSQKLVHVMRK